MGIHKIEINKNSNYIIENIGSTEVLYFKDSIDSSKLQYCFPGREFILSDKTCNYRNILSGYLNPLSYFTVTGQKQGCTVFFEDDGERKISFSKDSYKLILNIEYKNKYKIHKIKVVSHRTNWKDGLFLYRKWYREKYGTKKLSPKLKGCVNIWRYFFHRELCPGNVMKRNKSFDDIYRSLVKELGGAEIILLFDSAYNPSTKIRCGDEKPFGPYNINQKLSDNISLPLNQPQEERNFNNQISQIIKTNLIKLMYIDPYLVQKGSTADKKHSAFLKQKDQFGNDIKQWRPDEWAPCLLQQEWKNFCKSYIERGIKEFPFDGVYFDEIGNGNQYQCSNRLHNHAYPVDQKKAEREFISDVSPKGLLKVCEFFPNDTYLSSFDATLSDANSTIDILRFAHPEVKIFKMIHCDYPIGNDIKSVNKVLFNGEGFWIDSDFNNIEWYSEKVKAAIRRNYNIMKSYSEIFESSDCEPLIDCGGECLANRFTYEQRSIITVYNPFDKEKKAIINNGNCNIEVYVNSEEVRTFILQKRELKEINNYGQIEPITARKKI